MTTADVTAGTTTAATTSTGDTRLADAARRLGRRRITEDPQRLLLVGGGLLVALGIAAIGLGYWGTAHTGRLFLQVPYLMSGGTDAKHWAKLGMRCFGFTPLRLPPDLDFTALFHGVDERVPVDALQFGARVFDRFIDEL